MEWLIAALILIAIILGIAEFFLPGGILGVLSGLTALAAAIITFWEFGPVAGVVLTVGQLMMALIAFVLWIKLFPQSPVGRWFILTESVDRPAVEAAPEDLLGATGETLTRLNPSGAARIQGKRMAVVAQSGYIDAGVAIQVVKVEKRRIVVRPI